MSERRYLVVDDDPVFRDTLCRALRRRGADALGAANPAEARECLARHAPDRVILDLNLNGESGLALLREWGAGGAAAPEVVILTGYGSVATTVEAMKRGAVNYLCKPATVSEILAAFDEPPDDAAYAVDAPFSVDRLEWEHIQRVLGEHQGNVSATARALNMHRRTLQRKLQKRPVSR